MEKHLPIGNSGEKLVPTISDDHWRQLEHAYGSPLSRSVRSGIVHATNSYLFLRSIEATPERMAKVKIVLEAHDKAASRFFNELFTGPSATSDAGSYAHYLIENNFKSSQSSVTELGLDGLLEVLRTFHIACNTSIKQLNDPGSSDARKGDAWKSWITRLAMAVSEIDPATRVPTNYVRKRAKNLPSLVGELQAFLPRECRRDQAALSQDISEVLANKKDL